MVGDGLLVVPILERKVQSIKGALKGLQGRWYDYYTKKEMLGDEEVKTGLERIGCFVKGGKVIPTYDIKTSTKSSKDAKECNIHLFVALDEEENSQGKLYFDDGETFDYKQGSFARKTVTFNKDTLTWEGVEGSEYTLSNSVTKVIITGANPKYENAYLVEDGKDRQKVQLTKYAGYLMVEFVSLASKNFKIVLE